MSERFRLDRLLRVRAEEERAAKIEWAVEVSSAREAAAAGDAAEAALVRARREAARGRSGEVPGRALGTAPLEEAIFAVMGGEIERTAAAAEAAERAASEARARFDEARGRVLALERLQQRWARSRRRDRRRREARTLDETLAAIAARERRLDGEAERR